MMTMAVIFMAVDSPSMRSSTAVDEMAGGGGVNNGTQRLSMTEWRMLPTT